MSQWNPYYKKLANKPPRQLLVKALSFVGDDGYKEALDIGAGALNEYANQISHTKFKAINLPIEDYEFDRTFNLINAQFSLPFINHTIFKQTFSKIISCLDSAGILCGQFFGINDEWNISNTPMTFLTRKDTEELLQNLKILHLEEIEEGNETAAGNMKHWHVYNIIARKNNLSQNYF